MAIWKRKPQEHAGDYFFSGKGYMTQGVQSALSPEEIAFVVADLQNFVQEEDGVDYLQSYMSDDGRKVWCIDQLSRSMKQGGDYTPAQVAEYDHWTLLLPEEY